MIKLYLLIKALGLLQLLEFANSHDHAILIHCFKTEKRPCGGTQTIARFDKHAHGAHAPIQESTLPPTLPPAGRHAGRQAGGQAGGQAGRQQAGRQASRQAGTQARRHARTQARHAPACRIRMRTRTRIRSCWQLVLFHPPHTPAPATDCGKEGRRGAGVCIWIVSFWHPFSNHPKRRFLQRSQLSFGFGTTFKATPNENYSFWSSAILSTEGRV